MATISLAILDGIESAQVTQPQPPLFIVEGSAGAARSSWLAGQLEQRAAAATRTFNLSCEFAVGGPWAGVAELFATLLPEIQLHQPALIDAHGFELVHALPLLRRSMNVRGLSLTDLASRNERTRNYARDRAVRNVHGLIDLLDEWKSAACPDAQWVIACDFFDDAGAMSSLFFRELMRRRGSRLNIRLMAAVDAGRGDATRASFDATVQAQLLKLQFSPSSPVLMDAAAAAKAAEALEEHIGNDKLELSVNLPRLLYLWKCADQPANLLFRQWQALDLHLELGQYADAYRYSHGLLDLAFKHGDKASQFLIVEQLLVCHLTFDEFDEALRLAEEVGLPLAEGDGNRQERILYQMAMIYARFKKPRDFAKGEEYLERGLDALLTSAIPEEDLHFRYVFNRNGLAMIRNFQGRPEEALALCRGGLETLNEHIAPTSHRLHRSVLIYNMAQVFAATGTNEDALQNFAATIAMDPNYSEYYNDRGSLLFKMGRLEEARADYLHAIELSPPYFEVFANLGQCCRRMGNMPDAIRQYSRALDLEPNHLLARLGRAKAYEETGNSDAAVEDYSAALALDGTLWEALASRGVLHFEAGRLRQSLTDFDTAIELMPDVADLHENRAIVLAALEALEPAPCGN
jgi:tetratricopeptide (TPR) repeat protein